MSCHVKHVVSCHVYHIAEQSQVCTTIAYHLTAPAMRHKCDYYYYFIIITNLYYSIIMQKAADMDGCLTD